VRAALEGALQQLKQQCPSVVSSRRDRSLARVLPLLSASLAGGRMGGWGCVLTWRNWTGFQLSAGRGAQVTFLLPLME